MQQFLRPSQTPSIPLWSDTLKTSRSERSRLLTRIGRHPDIPVEQVLNDVSHVFHHPAVRDHHCEVHRNMYSTVERWVRSRPDGGHNLNTVLSSHSVKAGKNHTVPQDQQSHNHGGLPNMGNVGKMFGGGSHSKVAGAPWEALGRFREAPDVGPDGREIPGAFPATQTSFDSARPPTGPGMAYDSQTYLQAAQQEPHSQPSYSAQGAPTQAYYETPQGYQQGYQAGQQSSYPPQGGYPPPQPQYGYQEAPQYGYDPNAPPPQGQYGGPPQPGQYYGGGQY